VSCVNSTISKGPLLRNQCFFLRHRCATSECYGLTGYSRPVIETRIVMVSMLVLANCSAKWPNRGRADHASCALLQERTSPLTTSLLALGGAAASAACERCTSRYLQLRRAFCSFSTGELPGVARDFENPHFLFGMHRRNGLSSSPVASLVRTTTRQLKPNTRSTTPSRWG
jgi:hypothetical protein